MKKDLPQKPDSNSGPRKDPLLLGAHFSIAKGLHIALFEAQSYGCRALQLFTKNANTWRERTLADEEIVRFKAAVSETGIKAIASHTSYLINLAADDREKHTRSCHALAQELLRSSQLNIPFVVLHPGSHMGRGPAAGIRRIAESVNEIFAGNPGISTRLLFETTAGQGASVGHTFEQLAAIREMINPRYRIGFCLDSSHIFAAGYDIRSKAAYRKTMAAFEAAIGLKHLYIIHLNDSKKDLGSRVDRHEHIGEGLIGIRAFELFMNDDRLAHIPKIIETPKQKNGQDADRVNLDTLRSLRHA